MQDGTKVSNHLPYIIYYVRDLEISRKFYTERLGFRVRDFPVVSSMGKTACALSIQGTTILLMSSAAGEIFFSSDFGQHAPRPGQCFPGYRVEDIDAFHRNALASSVECLQEPRVDEFGSFGVYRDPDDLLFTVVQNKPAAEKHGIVFSGGGALGAFEIGVLQVLARRGIPIPTVITGTSVGGFNAAVLACELGAGRTMVQAAEALTARWQDKIAGGFHDNGVYRVRGDMSRLLLSGLPPGTVLSELAGDAGYFTVDSAKRLAHAAMSSGSLGKRISEVVDLSSVFSTEPLWDLVRNSMDFSQLAQSPSVLKLATTDWRSGALKIFTHFPSDEASAGGAQSRRIRPWEEEITAETFVDAVMASTAIPGVFPTVVVNTRGHNGKLERRHFADGGLVMNTPLNPAIEGEATTIHLICLNPLVEELPMDTLENTMDTLTRALVAAVAGMISNDLEQVKLVNRIAGIVRRKHSDHFYEAVTVHRYHPNIGNLGGLAGLLDFSGAHIQALINDGLDVAEGHDCKRDGCVIPA